MYANIRKASIAAVVGVLAVLLIVNLASGGRGGRGGGGGGARAGGGARGGGVSRPAAGGGISRPAGGGVGGGNIGGGGISRPSTPINRSPSISNPISRPSVQPKIGGGVGGVGGVGGAGGVGGLGPRDGPGIVAPPGLGSGSRPSGGIGVDPGFGVRPPVGGAGGIGGVGGVGGAGGIAGGKGGAGIGGGGIGGGIGAHGTGGLPGLGSGRPSNQLPGLGQGPGGGVNNNRPGDYLGRRQDNISDRKANITDRSQNLQNRLDQRQDFRDQRQDQRQDYLSDRREDWQNWHDDYYGHHDNWYHGSWCEHSGGYWSHMWSDHTAAMVLGTTLWGLNRMSYWFGYDNYYNPYYTDPLVVGNTTIYYSEALAAPPVQTVVADPTKEPAGLPPGVTQEGMMHFEAARVSFYNANFTEALDSVNKALASMPRDAVLHEFRALVLFSMGNYKEAAMALHPVLAVGPGWDWTTMSSLYPGNYTSYLRKLEDYTGQNPKSAEAHFLLGYHYMTLGHVDNAVSEFAEVQKLVPKDTVSAQMVQMLDKTGKASVPSAESDVKIDVAKLIGSWKATRGDKATFEFTLEKDKGFTWTYQEGKTKEQVKGAYALDGNVLALEPDGGGIMIAEITEPKDGTFVFRVDGAPKNDPGLTFKAK